MDLWRTRTRGHGTHSRSHASLVLLQYPDDLLFHVPGLLHRQLPRSTYERTSVSTGRDFPGQVISLSGGRERRSHGAKHLSNAVLNAGS